MITQSDRLPVDECLMVLFRFLLRRRQCFQQRKRPEETRQWKRPDNGRDPNCCCSNLKRSTERRDEIPERIARKNFIDLWPFTLLIMEGAKEWIISRYPEIYLLNTGWSPIGRYALRDEYESSTISGYTYWIPVVHRFNQTTSKSEKTTHRVE